MTSRMLTATIDLLMVRLLLFFPLLSATINNIPYSYMLVFYPFDLFSVLLFYSPIPFIADTPRT